MPVDVQVRTTKKCATISPHRPQCVLEGKGTRGRADSAGTLFFFGAVKVIVCWKSGGMEEK
jgi:hypothetical protein